MKSILSGVLFTMSLLLCSAASADRYGGTNNFWVLGSYHKQSAANDRARILQSTLGVQIQQQSVQLNGVTHHRLLVSEMNLDGERDQRLVTLGVTPWLITLKVDSPQALSLQALSLQASVTQTPIAPGSEYQLILVGVFDNVDDALGLERQIARVDLPVRGEAKLVGGNVMHHVWLGPVSDLETLEDKMLAMNLSKLDTRAATFAEAASVTRARGLDRRPEKVLEKAKSIPSKQYPENFNLARLPEKRPPPAKAP